MKTPSTVFNYFLECLDKTHMAFDMSFWYQDGKELIHSLSSSVETREGPADVENDCGTSACIAGSVAMEIDPNSNIQADIICRHWVSDNQPPTKGSEVHISNEVLSMVFNYEECYGPYRDLSEVTLDDARKLLSELSTYQTWKEVLSRLKEIERGNRLALQS